MVLPYDEAGSGPALVLLHAGVADRRMWREQLGPLAAAGYRVVAVDLPGFGDAPPPGSREGPWADVVETMDALQIDRAAIVGVSNGAWVAQRIAHDHPERVAALALVSSAAPGHEFSAELAAADAREVDALEDGDLDGAVQAVLESWTLAGMPEVRERVAEMQRRAFELQALDDSDEDAEEDEYGSDPAALARITAPTLVVDGELDWEDFAACGEVLETNIPDVRRVRIAAAGHLPPMEQPEAFRIALLEFLADTQGAGAR